jgi:hypothetical protein
MSKLTGVAPQPEDVHSYFYSDAEEPTVVKITHQVSRLNASMTGG